MPGMRLTKFNLILLILAVSAAAALAVLGAMRRSAQDPPIDPARLPFRIETICAAGRASKLPFFVADVDLDGDEDLLVNEYNRFVWYRLRGNEMALEGEGSYKGRGWVRDVMDVTGDGRPEYFVVAQNDEKVEISCYDWFSPRGASEPLYTIALPISTNPEWENLLSRIAMWGSSLSPTNPRPKIFIGVNTLSSQREPRSLFAFDAATGHAEWRFDFGPHCHQVLRLDAGDEGAHLLMSTVGIGVGREYNGTIDSLAYLFCLDERDGAPIWKRRLGGRGSRSYLALADFDGDGRSEIAVGLHTTRKESELRFGSLPWNIAIVSSSGEILASKKLPLDPLRLISADVDGDGRPEIVVEGTKYTLATFNADLKMRSLLSYDFLRSFSSVNLIEAWDLVGEGRAEIVAQMGNMLTLIDSKEAVVAALRFETYRLPGNTKPIRFGGKNHLVAASMDSVCVMAFERTPLADRTRAYARPLAIGASAIVLAASGIALLVRVALKRRRERRVGLLQAQDELLTAMMAFGHGGSSLKVLDRIRLHLKNWERIRAEGVTREELFGRLSQTFEETVVPEIERIMMLARRAGAPEKGWGALMADADAARAEMQGVVGSVSERVSDRDDCIARALRALDSVDGSIAEIRAHLRDVFRVPVVEELDRLVARFREESAAKWISFALEADPAAAGAVFISPVSFGKIYESLLANAVRAVEGNANGEIFVTVQWEGNYCRIDVRDNGCGIPREDWDRVFDRHYTTKAEGGFGLHYAREELARFGGRIYVAVSVEGSGTTMRTVLRKSEKAGGA